MASTQLPRSKHFRPDREPHRHDSSLQIIQSKVEGPVSFLNPTQAHYQHHISTSSDHDQHQDTDIPSGTPTPTTESRQPAANVEYKWTSRNNRKGRHAITVKPQSVDRPAANISTPRLTTHWRSILHTLWRMLTYYPIWDVSWCVAYIFTLGSVLWVINSFFAFLPLLKPSTEFHNEVLVGGGVTAFIGATIFEIGSVLLMLEAINENREGCFGWAVEKVYGEYFGEAKSHHRGGWKIVPDLKSCTHHHRNKKNFVGKPHNIPHTSNDVDPEKQSTGTDKSWVWCPSWVELKTHYFHELGFIACFSQLMGATIFWISGFTALPGIYNKLSPAAVDGAYWFPQVLGGLGFVISGTLFMVETQKHWWQPAPSVLGWHIGVWNLIGGVGFTLCPAFGFDTQSWAQYQASCSTFWGSWAFLIGSVIQLYESLDKSPVALEKS